MPDDLDKTADSAETADQLPVPPRGLLKRGRELWAEMSGSWSGDSGALTLLAEACRTADRCERLDAQLRGRDREWLTLRDVDADGSTFVVVVNGALREARAQQLTLRQLLAQLNVGKSAVSAPVAVASLADQLAEARANREASTA